MKRFGVCSVLIACCLAAPAWADDYGDQQSAAGIAPGSLSGGQIEVATEDSYAPWQVYGYGSPYDQSAIAGYNAWPQVCTDGLWDNFCNEQHCHCYKGPKQHSCQSCGTAGYGSGNRGFHHKQFTAVNNIHSNCANGNCGSSGNVAPDWDSQSMPERSLEPQPTLVPQAVPEPPAEGQASARLLPRNNPVRQPLMPANWRGVK